MVIYKSETRQDPTEAAGHQLSGPFGLPPRVAATLSFFALCIYHFLGYLQTIIYIPTNIFTIGVTHLSGNVAHVEVNTF